MRRTWIMLAAISGLLMGAWTSGILRKPNFSQAAASSQVKVEQPRLELIENNFDFGVIEAGQTGRRSFTIRNVGKADLTLQLRETTCKCTLARLERAVIPPGGVTEIELEWRSDEPNERFYQGARIETNDPERRRIDLRVEGRIRNRLGIWPELVFFSEVPRNAERSLHVQLYSQFYDEVKIIKAESSLPGATVRLTDESSTELPFESRFNRVLVVEYAAGSKPGPFTGTIAIEYEGTDREGRLNHGRYRLDFGGETVGDFSLHGRNVVGRLLNLGTFAQAEGSREQAFVHFRGDASDVELTAVSVTPEFAQVRVGEPQKLSPTMTRYPVEVVVPPESPIVNLSSTTGGLGSVVLRTSHPDYPEVRFQLSLVVLP